MCVRRVRLFDGDMEMVFVKLRFICEDFFFSTQNYGGLGMEESSPSGDCSAAPHYLVA